MHGQIVRNPHARGRVHTRQAMHCVLAQLYSKADTRRRSLPAGRAAFLRRPAWLAKTAAADEKLDGNPQTAFDGTCRWNACDRTAPMAQHAIFTPARPCGWNRNGNALHGAPFSSKRARMPAWGNSAVRIVANFDDAFSYDTGRSQIIAASGSVIGSARVAAGGRPSWNAAIWLTRTNAPGSPTGLPDSANPRVRGG